MDTAQNVIDVSMKVAVRASGGSTPVQCRLQYDPADPYAISATFHAWHDVVCWMFARDLLAAGLQTTAGDGDVRICPADDRTKLLFELQSPDGFVALHAPRDEIVAFLDRTYHAVPIGTESRHIDVEQELTKLTAE